MKICGVCKQELQDSEFWKRTLKTKVIRQSVCKDCSSKRRVTYYNGHKAAERVVRNKRVRKTKEWYYAFKKTLQCETCGESRHYVLDFHHKDKSTKSNNVSQLIADSAPKERILKEIKKCKVLCANCHREVHYNGVLC